MSSYIYKQSHYKAGHSLPPSTWDKCKKEFELYLENYIPGRTHRLYVKVLVRLWFLWVNFRKHVQDFTPEKRDEFLRHQDKRWFFSHSLLTLSYSVALKKDSRQVDQFERAAILIRAALDFYSELCEGRLAQDLIRGEPAEMGQYFNIFGCNLVPGALDYMQRVDSCEYIVVCIAERYYKMNISAQVTVDDLFTTLSEMSAEAQKSKPKPLGWVSVAPRALCREIYNSDFACFEKAFFVVCLDEDKVPSEKSFFQNMQVSHCGNRWFHSSLQLVVNRAGNAGAILSNRNYIDGNVGGRFCDEIYQRSTKIELPRKLKFASACSFQSIQISLSELDLRRSSDSVAPYVNKQDYCYTVKMHTAPGGKKDSLFIAALLLATARYYGEPLKVIHLCNMSKYMHLGLTHAFVTTKEFSLFSNFVRNGVYDKRIAKALLEDFFNSKEQSLKFARSSTWLAHNLAKTVCEHMTSFKLLLKLFFLKHAKAQVLTSHPQEFSSIDSFGRPGVLLPQVSHFGLHYMFKSDHIDLVFMPETSNAASMIELSKEIQKSWDEICEIYFSTKIQSLSRQENELSL